MFFVAIYERVCGTFHTQRQLYPTFLHCKQDPDKIGISLCKPVCLKMHGEKMRGAVVE